MNALHKQSGSSTASDVLQQLQDKSQLYLETALLLMQGAKCVT